MMKALADWLIVFGIAALAVVIILLALGIL